MKKIDHKISTTQKPNDLPPDITGFENGAGQTGLYRTGICDTYFSKRTIVTALTTLKSAIRNRGFIVSHNTVKPYTFEEVVNDSGCIFLRGKTCTGMSIYELYRNFTPDPSFFGSNQKLLKTIRLLITAARTVQEKTGSYPPILLNAIYIDETSQTVTFLPFSVVDTINRHQDERLQAILYTCLSDTGYGPPHFTISESTTTYGTKEALFWGIARLIYLFYTAGKGIMDSPPYIYLQNCIADIPRVLADAVWSALHKKEYDVVSKAIAESLDARQGAPAQRIPLLKRQKMAVISHKTGMVFRTRWKLITIILICAGIGYYLISDMISGRHKTELPPGLSPRQVVELYYKAIDELDLDLIDSLFYKHAGKEIKDELSTLYVMLRMEQAFGEKLAAPDEHTGADDIPQGYKIYGIRDLRIEDKTSTGNPVFFTTYTRVLSSEGKLYKSRIEETIYLQYINDRWYITKSERKVTESTHPP